ncbi:MAG: hypothetical protein ACRDI0_03455 [Actinomycetota bacterium]
MTRSCAALIALLLAACARPPENDAPGRPAEKPPGEQLYELTTTVLEDETHGPMLCPGGQTSSLPPQCGNVPITNWDWDEVDGEERMSGTIWGAFHVVGTFDGQAFTVTEVGPPGDQWFPFDHEIVAGCPEPEDGRAWPDPDRASQDDLDAAHALARSEPDFAGFWIDHLATPNPRTPSDAQQVVITAAFTGDLDRHEADLRQEWGGPLCMVQFPRTYKELKAIQKELGFEEIGELGLQLLYSDIDITSNVVEIYVVVLDDDARQALDERYGKGTVRATAALKPVS